MNDDGQFGPNESPDVIAAQLRDLHQWGVRTLPVSTLDPAELKAAELKAAQSAAAKVIEEPATPPPVVAAPTEPTAQPTPSSSDSNSNPAEQLAILSQEVAACQACEELCSKRTQTVFGVGNPEARLCFFGEGPGADEDRLGEPFVGKAGQLLDKIIAACTMKREDVYILNTVKCRPPGNRNPAEDEIANCRPFFERQFEIIQPEFICCLGSVAAKTLLNSTQSVGRMRGQFFDYNGAQVIVTYHPAYLLRNPSAKKDVWQDMQMLLKAMGIELPKA